MIAPARRSASMHRRVLWTARLACAAAILAVLSAIVPLDEVGAALAQADAWPLIVAIALSLAIQWLIAERLRRIVDVLGARFSTGELFEINLTALFYAVFLPAGNVTGLLARLYKLSRRENNYAAVLVALLLDRVLATLTLCAIGVAAWPFAARPGSEPIFILVLGALGVLVALMLLVLRTRPPRLPALRSSLGGRISAALESALARLRQVRAIPRPILALAVALTLSAHLVWIVAYAVIAAGLGLDLSFAAIAWARSAATLVAIAPVSVAGLGVREGAMVVLLAPYGVSAAEALAFSLLAFSDHAQRRGPGRPARSSAHAPAAKDGAVAGSGRAGTMSRGDQATADAAKDGSRCALRDEIRVAGEHGERHDRRWLPERLQMLLHVFDITGTHGRQAAAPRCPHQTFFAALGHARMAPGWQGLLPRVAKPVGC